MSNNGSKMAVENAKILKNEKIAPDVYQMTLSIDTSWIHNSGQFVEVSVQPMKLKRPISITSWTDSTMTLTYKVVGEGTRIMSEMKEDSYVEMLTNCGNGFDLSNFKDEILVVGGGIGCAPCIGVIQEALKLGLKVKAVFGFRSEEERYFEKELEEFGVEYAFAYDNKKENVVTKMKEMNWDNIPFATCGPTRMMQAVCANNPSYGLVSLETRMGCGFGACMGCSVEMKSGMKRICKEGPVFEKEEVLWENLK